MGSQIFLPGGGGAWRFWRSRSSRRSAPDYRAAYIINAARAVASGDIDLDAAAAMDGDAARRYLKGLNGVGDKVANCAVLFGLHRLDAFPVDVWIKRALREHIRSARLSTPKASANTPAWPSSTCSSPSGEKSAGRWR